eukprot:TRINITY_DN8120_c0_g1_i1.p1 TRINITY_DN8120_c0_g1~~TRINITY_DN8120_c0_g1_i1.p1  ORF type:complete len:373 (+),score=93.34 TRINITY_DN8120_c0_g1_i1:219-1337(+)
MRWCVVLLNALLVLLAAVVGYAWFAAVQQRSPFPTAEVLAAEGGLFFRRPSDGGRSEFFASGVLLAGAPLPVPTPSTLPGAETARHLVVFLHGSSSTGRSCLGAYDRLIPALLEHHAALLCPSLPGFGASEPYADGTQRNLEAYMRSVAEDTAALVVDTLQRGVPHDVPVSLIGVSLGAEFAVAAAAALEERGVTVRGVSTAVAGLLPCAEFGGFPEHSGLGTRIFSRLNSFEPVGRTMVAVLMAPMLGNVQGEHLEGAAGFGRLSQEARTALANDMRRSMQHTLVGTLHCTVHWMSAHDRPLPKHYRVVREKSTARLLLFLGSEDEVASRANSLFLQEQLPRAVLREFEGGHGEAPWDTIVHELLAAPMDE